MDLPLFVVCLFMLPPIQAVMGPYRRPLETPEPDEYFLFGPPGPLALMIRLQIAYTLGLLVNFVMVRGYNSNLTATPFGYVIAYIDVLIYLAFTALTLVTTITMLEKRKVFRRWFVVQWLVAPLAYYLDYAVFHLAFGSSFDHSLLAFDKQSVIGIFILNTIWSRFLWVSEPAKKMMVN